MRVFFDLSRLDIVTEKEMASKFAEDKTFGGSFPAYLENCLAENGGDLKEITPETLKFAHDQFVLRSQLSNPH